MNKFSIFRFFWCTLIVLMSQMAVAQEIINYLGYRAGIDIGAQGVKISVMGFYNRSNKLKYKLIYERQESVGLVKGMETNGGKLRTSDIQDAVSFAQEMIEDAKTTYKLTNKDFIMYSSSGVNMAGNIGELDAQAQKTLGMGVNTSLTSKAEAAYGTRASMDRDDFDNAILVDVGGGSSKGGILQKYVAADGKEKYTFKSFNIEYGARRLSERIAKRTTNFDDYQKQLKGMVEDTLGILIRSSLSDNPGISLGQRNTIYVTGGAAYQFITWLFPEKVQDEIVEFKYSDLQDFEYMLRRENGWKTFATRQFDNITDANLRQLMVKDHEKATQKVYNRDACLAGISLMKQIVKEIGNPESKTFYFSRDAYWINVLIYDAFKADFTKRS